MKLLTKKIKKDAKKQYKFGSDLTQMVVAKFFNPVGSGTWYLMNMDEDEDYCWGIVDWMACEMGSFSMKELESVKLPLGLGIERDLYFEPIKAETLWDSIKRF
jgi:hypothetical protein